MAYTPQTWTDTPATTTPLSAARLTYMETGIDDAHTIADAPVGTAKITDGAVTAAKLSATYAPATPAGGGSYVTTLSTLFQTVPRLKYVANTTLGIDAQGAVVDMDSVAATTLTLPPTSSVAWLDHAVVSVASLNSGAVTLALGSGVSTIPSDGKLRLTSAGAAGALRKLPSTPATLPTTGLLLRFKADDIAVANGQPVTSWPETSGNGHPAATPPLTANQPVLLTNSLNGHKVVSFDGNNDYLSMAGSALGVGQNKSQVMVCIAYTYPSVATGVRTLFGLSNGTTSTSTRQIMYHRDTAGFRGCGGRRLDADTAAFISGTASTVGQAEQMFGVWDYTNTDLILYQGGTSGASNTSFQTTGSSSNTASLAGTIGANLAGAAEYFFGSIAEVVVYSVVDATTRAAVSTYFQATYGITGSDASAAGDVWFKEGSWVT